jgi:hypothetical protein
MLLSILAGVIVGLIGSLPMIVKHKRFMDGADAELCLPDRGMSQIDFDASVDAFMEANK